MLTAGYTGSTKSRTHSPPPHEEPRHGEFAGIVHRPAERPPPRGEAARQGPPEDGEGRDGAGPPLRVRGAPGGHEGAGDEARSHLPGAWRQAGPEEVRRDGGARPGGPRADRGEARPRRPRRRADRGSP